MSASQLAMELGTKQMLNGQESATHAIPVLTRVHIKRIVNILIESKQSFTFPACHGGYKSVEKEMNESAWQILTMHNSAHKGGFLGHLATLYTRAGHIKVVGMAQTISSTSRRKVCVWQATK